MMGCHSEPSSSKGEEERRNDNAMVVILAGAPDSAKSTFCHHVMRSSTRQWVLVSQDTIGNGKAGTKTQGLTSAAIVLKDGKSVFIDVCNLDKEQWADFAKPIGSRIDVQAVVFDLPVKPCNALSVKRTEREGNLEGGKAGDEANQMSQKKELPKRSEGHRRITICQSESDVQAAINTYSSIGISDTLPSGGFGQKNLDVLIELALTMFLKEVDGLLNGGSGANSFRNSNENKITNEMNRCNERLGSDQLGSEMLKSPDLFEIGPQNQTSISDRKVKRDGILESDRNKKCKGFQEDPGSDLINPPGGDNNPNSENIHGSTGKVWGPWAQALHHIAMHPEGHKSDVMEVSDDVVVLNNPHPRARRHLLVLARLAGLDRLADVRKEHLPLLRTMHAVGLKWAEKFSSEDESLVFRLGYHSDPSMRQLHLHVVSQDFDSEQLKNKRHWNTFNSAFFRDSVDVIEEINTHGRAILKDEESLLSMELCCHRCRSPHPTIPRLKSHISSCRAPFPATLLQKGRLVRAPSKDGH